MSSNDTNILANARIAVLGYGSQGRAHALNLRDSGLDVVVGLRPNGPTWHKAKAEGFTVVEPAEAVKGADLVAVLTPDMVQPTLYKRVDRAEHQARRGAAVRARLQRALRPDRAARGHRRDPGRAEGPGRAGAHRVRARPRRAEHLGGATRTSAARPRRRPRPMPTASAAVAR